MEIDSHFLILILLAVAAAALGMLYRWVRSRDLPNVSDREFFEEMTRRYPIMASPEVVLQERRRIARILGIAPEKLAPTQTVDFLSERQGPLQRGVKRESRYCSDFFAIESIAGPKSLLPPRLTL